MLQTLVRREQTEGDNRSSASCGELSRQFCGGCGSHKILANMGKFYELVS